MEAKPRTVAIKLTTDAMKNVVGGAGLVTTSALSAVSIKGLAIGRVYPVL
jgi:hypothetical protein